MKTKRHAAAALVSVCSILSIVEGLLLFDGEAEARQRHSFSHGASGTRQMPDAGVAVGGATTETEVVTIGGGAPDKSESSPSPVVPAQVGGTPTGPAGGSSQAVVAFSAPAPRPTAASRPGTLGGFNVSFKLDPQQADILYKHMGDSWVAAPLALHASARERFARTVEAKVDILDVTGRPMDVRAEWIPTDPEMVTVSPREGNAVQITVRHAGQSSLRVNSQLASKQLSVMAWYQDDVLQAEISEQP